MPDDELVLVEGVRVPDGPEDAYQRRLTMKYVPGDVPGAEMVQIIANGEGLFAAVYGITEREWREISDRLERAVPFFQRVANLLASVEQTTAKCKDDEAAKELRWAVREFAGAAEAEREAEAE